MMTFPSTTFSFRDVILTVIGSNVSAPFMDVKTNIKSFFNILSDELDNVYYNWDNVDTMLRKLEGSGIIVNKFDVGTSRYVYSLTEQGMAEYDYLVYSIEKNRVLPLILRCLGLPASRPKFGRTY